ncbi:MAG: hypothetical protein EWV61_16035 [Microcystis aeruginosa Ma_AC_P_19900807_S300]|nr:MAG: hypothetical protein EWV61_16035 [Microcystis aeruginosa Ma_AC_P_19900807_S300]
MLKIVRYPPYQGGIKGGSAPLIKGGFRGDQHPPYQGGIQGGSSPLIKGGSRGDSGGDQLTCQLNRTISNQIQ